MKKIKILLPVLSVMGLAMTSCKKDVNNYVVPQEPRVYVTRHDSTANFAGYQTFRIADSVNVVKDGAFVKYAFNAYDSTLSAALSQAMQQRGYILVTDKTIKPDLGIHISRIYSDYSGVINYDNYWSVYGTYWDPYYWGYYNYGYYFPYNFDTYAVREGLLTVDMIDLKNPDVSTNKLHSIWSGIGWGTGIFDPTVVNEEVAALFDKSTYIEE